MNPTFVDRDTFLQNLRVSKLLTVEQFSIVVDKLASVHDAREIAKALASWKLLTKFQAKMLLVGRNSGFFIGPYRILDHLGQGGMGRVYKATHQTMNRTVALKVLSSQLVNTERAQQLFLHEVQAAAQLNHPNIVVAYDHNEAGGRHYLAMEFVDGPNLERFVKKKGPLPVGLACEIVFQTAHGLAYTHEKGMVHRDIKPANLLVQRDNGNVQVKILDFGLARLHQSDQDGSRTIAAKERTVMGTPDFLSPEQSRDLHDVDIRADLYSLGCTFYFLLTGKVPFPGGTTMDKLIRHNGEIAQPIEDLRSEVPKAVANIVRMLMEKNPDDRYQSPDELMDALAPYAAPTPMDWPPAPSQTATSDRASQDEINLGEEPQADTEPRVKSATKIGHEDSILDWVDEHGRQRRARRFIAAALVATGVLALATAGLAVWVFNNP